LGGALEMGAYDPAHAAVATRIRGAGPRAFERATRAVPPVGRGGQHRGGHPAHAVAVLPPAPAPGTTQPPATADRDDSEESAAPPAGIVSARGAGDRRVAAGARRRQVHGGPGA